MRRKNERNDYNYDDKQQLQGWNIDPDDLPSCSSLLKILEKKITFPLLEKQQKKSRKSHKNLQNLPTIQQGAQKKQQSQLKRKKKYSHLSPIMKTEKIQKPSTPYEMKTQNSRPKKHKTQATKLSPTNNQQNNQNLVSNIPNFKQKNESFKKFNRSYLKFFDSIKSPVQNGCSPQQKKLIKIRKHQHNKAPSVETLNIKTKIAELNLDEKYQQQEKVDSKKVIRWDKFSISQDKLAQVCKNIESMRILPKQASQRKNQKQLKITDKVVAQKKSSSVWLQRLVHKKQFQNRALKTQSKNFFIDDHLQNTPPHQIKNNKKVQI